MRNDIRLLSAGQKERLVLLEARLLQGIHKFEQAQQHLKKINHSRSPAAQLLLADINIQQGNIKKAKEYCKVACWYMDPLVNADRACRLK